MIHAKNMSRTCIKMLKEQSQENIHMKEASTGKETNVGDYIDGVRVERKNKRLMH